MGSACGELAGEEAGGDAQTLGHAPPWITPGKSGDQGEATLTPGH